MTTLKRWVRIQPKQQTQSFYRCGIGFGRDWLPVEVDKATADRLEQEQMLEVSDTDPVAGAGEDIPSPPAPLPLAGEGSETAAAPAVADLPAAGATDADKFIAVRDAIVGLDKTVETNWKKDGAPNTAAIAAVVGFDVTAAMRDAAWAELEKERIAIEAAGS